MPDRPKPPTLKPTDPHARTCIRCGVPVDEINPDCGSCLMRHVMRMKRAQARQAEGAATGDAA